MERLKRYYSNFSNVFVKLYYFEMDNLEWVFDPIYFLFYGSVLIFTVPAVLLDPLMT